MAENSSDSIEWLLELKRDDAGWLGDIRGWQHLRIATEETSIWVKGFNEREINATAVRCIPAKKVWYKRDNLLFAQGSLVPSRKAPSLLWTPIELGLPIELPPLNHNYFGIREQVAISLVQATAERPTVAMCVSLNLLGNYIQKAPAIRLAPLRWIILGDAHALVLGIPLLPIPAEVFWSEGDFLIPAGYDFEWPALIAPLTGKLSNDGEPGFILWNRDATFSRIPKSSFRQLSIGSFRQSVSINLNT